MSEEHKISIDEKIIKPLENVLSREVILLFCNNILNATRPNTKTITESDITSIIELFKSYGPRDAVEATLVQQMIITDSMITHTSGIVRIETDVKIMKAMGDLLIKLSLNFTKQMETLKKYRTNVTQKIQVEHVNVMPGGQAIVGNVMPAEKNGKIIG